MLLFQVLAERKRILFSPNLQLKVNENTNLVKKKNIYLCNTRRLAMVTLPFPICFTDVTPDVGEL